MVNTAKINLILHTMGNVAIQAAIIDLINEPLTRSLIQVFFSIIGVVLAFKDTSAMKQKNGEGE